MPVKTKPNSPTVGQRMRRWGCAIVGLLVIGAVVGGFWIWANADEQPEFYVERLVMPPEQAAQETRNLEQKVAKLEQLTTNLFGSVPRRTTIPATTEGGASIPPSQSVPPVSEAEPPETPDSETLPAEPATPLPPARDPNIPRWSVTLTEAEINAYLATQIDTVVPDLSVNGLKQPRVILEQGRGRVAFRVERGDLAGVVSLTVEPRLVPGGSDQMVFGVTEARLGHVPIPLGTILDQIPQPKMPPGLDVAWYSTDEGAAVEADWSENLRRAQSRVLHVDTVEISPGTITVAGEVGQPNG